MKNLFYSKKCILLVLFVALICLSLCFGACQTKCEHKNAKWIVDRDSTCEQVGSRHLYCEDCRETLQTEEIAKKNHTEVVVNGMVPNCLHSGLTDGSICSICGTVTVEQQVLPVLEHKYENGICVMCKKFKPSDGLEYTLSPDESGYIVTGIGSCLDREVVIDNEHEGKSVVGIATNAFGMDVAVASVLIPNSVTVVQKYAFYSLKHFTIYCEAGVKPLDWDENWCFSNYPIVWNCRENDIADDGCIYTVINGVRYSIENEQAAVAEQPINIVSADISQQITYKNIEYTVTKIRDSAFHNCTYCARITVPASVTHIGSSAFYYCYSLTEILIPASVQRIDNWAFFECKALTIYCEMNAPRWDSWGGTWNYSNCPVVWNCATTNLADDNKYYTVVSGIRFSVANGVATVVRQPRDLSGDVVIPQSIDFDGATVPVRTVEDYAFFNCYKLESISFAKSIKKIGTNAFMNCRNLKSICFAANGNLSKLGNLCFYGCKSLEEVYLPSSVTNIGQDAFLYCLSLKSISVDSANSKYKSIDGVLYNKGGDILLVYPSGKPDSEFIIPQEVTKIAESAFNKCESLIKIFIPSTVSQIEKNAFFACEHATLYCQVTSLPPEWSIDWNVTQTPVVWGAK